MTVTPSAPTTPAIDTAAAPRVVVTTDPELDDLNSMLRLLLHANELDLAALVYSASGPHHRGNAALGVAPHRWPAPGETLHIDQAINAYEQVENTLRVHDPRYPTAAHLRSLVRLGNVDEVGDMREATPGSDLIVDVLLDGLVDDAGHPFPGEPTALRRVFLQAWGGLNTIARALLTIEERYGEDPAWPGLRRRLTQRTVVTSFGEQDNTLRDYIRPHWPGLEHREVATMVWGYLARTVALPEDREVLGAAWMREHVTAVGPMGAAYRVWGDGLQMADGFDDEDYFGVPDALELGREGLETRGYKVWAPVEEPGAWISEGDSSNFALLVDNGLRGWIDATWGGWGGRQVRALDAENAWTSALPMPPGVGGDGPRPDPVTDAAEDGTCPPEYHAARWLRAFQNELAARLCWSVTPRYEDANHAPVVDVAQGLALSAAPGARLTLTGSATDPDGDAVALRWWVYREAGTCPLPAAVEDDGAGRAVLTVPEGAEAGQTVHAILEATDSGVPALTRYQRVVVTVA